MASGKDSITGSFTSATTSDTLQVRGVRQRGVEYIWLLIQGTFVGTVQIQINRMGRTTNWVAMTNGTFTAPTSQVVEIPANCDVRLECTAYVSGTAEYLVTMD